MVIQLTRSIMIIKQKKNERKRQKKERKKEEKSSLSQQKYFIYIIWLVFQADYLLFRYIYFKIYYQFYFTLICNMKTPFKYFVSANPQRHLVQ